MRLRAMLGAGVIVLAGCGGGSDVEGPVTVAGGGTTGIYYNYGGALAGVLGDELGIESEVTVTGGSIDNLRRLDDGRADLAFSAADAAGDAVAGDPPFDEPIPVRAVARVYDEFVHLIVPAGSAITSIEDLRGRDVSLGAAGSGTEVIADRLLSAAGISRGDLMNAELGIDASIRALRDGEIDAFFWTGGLPTPGITGLSKTFDIELVPLDTLVDDVRARYGSGYRQGVVPRGTYGIEMDVETLAVPNFLVVREDAPDEIVYETLSVLFEQQAAIAADVAAAGLLDRHRAIYTEPVDLHEAAIEYYRHTKP